MMSKLLTLSIFLISCSTPVRENSNNHQERNPEVKNTEEKVANREVVDLGGIDSCLDLLNQVNRTDLKELTERFTTSTILSNNERKSYSISNKEGTVGLYNLFYSNGPDILKLGELVVYTESDPNTWQMFGENEQILSIELISSEYNIDDVIKVGARISDILANNKSIMKVSNKLYQFKDNCESITIKTNNGVVTSLKVRRINP
ncbi:hypothetical protein LVD17_02730 [Fulvivirga ulvae]|uniref:hypothetical protein n=1 Tax=Fulvivirga ulvae TaxID=2904245 RepID=UPI001F3A9E81|nr:hypothetical protein [Fulvivirga ulvae]UII32749.1 hypothetical protein LVD17_02730 [Fulvivirga ulvae]